ncbi:MAG: TrmJ/YjtD family RNA methyltransferase [Treponema sp.]|jgi:tRNA/rRNA methyltransferase/tRNA (cytidine32/uridine32-2'-O)-methyltransferase|nr:TrmJ/YjtD family RNA methyltransferase [Treponema sp.]
MQLDQIKIVLSQVSEAGNVGAACRAMKNMGLSHLRLASALPLVLEKIYERAVNAWDIWEKACQFDTLAEATADCSIVVGTTCRRGHKRKSISMTPRDLASWLAKCEGPAAIVFGNERTGLQKAELELCNFASHIPVTHECPSLNLSHAVQLYAYELFLAMQQQLPVKGEWTPMNQTEISALVGTITDTLTNAGFYKYPNREYQSRFLHDVIARAGLAEREGRYLGDIIVKATRI